MKNAVVHCLRTIYQTSRHTARMAVLPLLRPRRLNACCCGLSKTGTHSIAGIFENYRCEHHPDTSTRLPLAIAYLNQEVDNEHAQRILKKQDRSMWLEMESSSLAGILISAIVEACPKKKFILTMRDVYSWCDSWLDHNINSPPSDSSPWARLDKVRLRIKDFPPTKYDAPLTELGFPSLACYFQLWGSHNAQVLETVPDERLLIIRTQDIIEMLPKIAEWLEVGADTLKPERGWLFAAPKKHGTLAKLDRVYVRETAEAFCDTLMQQYFPDTTLHSVLAHRMVESVSAS